MKRVEVKIAEDGEILVRGELVMKGYWNNPDATAQVLKDERPVVIILYNMYHHTCLDTA